MMEETERDCLLFAFYATVGEVIDQVSAASSLSQRHTEDLTDNISSILQHGCSVQVLYVFCDTLWVLQWGLL